MRARVLLLGLLALNCRPLCAQEALEREVLVEGREAGEEFEEPGGAGQPQWAERSRASSTTKLYVLSPFELFAGVISESDFDRAGRTTHDLTQEIEFGLPGRFEIDLENHVGVDGDGACETSVGAGLRYAFANWGKLPLNPAIAAAYHFGFEHRADACEVRLLLGQEFVPRLQWAANLVFQKEIAGPREREMGFTQDLAYLVIADKLELGTEMRYTNRSRQSGSWNEFIVGPSVNWKPNLHTVVSLAPLFGCTPASPRVVLFFSASLEFGGGESKTVPLRR